MLTTLAQRITSDSSDASALCVQQLLAKGRSGPIRMQHGSSIDASDFHELELERGIEEHGRVSAIHGRPWHEVPPGSTAPVHWLDSTHDGGPVDRPWERTERDRLRREDREHRERLERMARQHTATAT